MAQETRPIRGCDVCGQVDDHPRHVVAVIESRGPKTFIRHMDCCAASGCEACRATEEVVGHLKGEEKLNAILSGALADVEV